MRQLLAWLDAKLFDFLMSRHEDVPARFVKLIASHYPDARTRRVYWSKLNVQMGAGTFANAGLLVVNTPDDDARIQIGSRVSIAPGVILITDSSPSNSPLLMNHPEVLASMVRRAPIIIEDDVWIGAGVIILPGVTIGRAVVIGAGAVVTQDVPAGTVVAGIPARPLRNLTN